MGPLSAKRGYAARIATIGFTLIELLVVLVVLGIAASLVAAGSLDRAREVGAALLKVDPAFSVEKFCSWYPLKQPERRALMAERLIQAGLPH